MRKSFPTKAVVGTWSGFTLDRFDGIHEVMDHLYPGIMTIGVAAMQPNAAKYLARTVPGLAEFSEITGNNWKERAEEAIARFGQTIEVEGPLNTSDAEIDRAYDQFARGVPVPKGEP